jgi:zinc-binding alcohol dehydrogenase family protein
MKAITFRKASSLSAHDCLVDVERQPPVPGHRDLLVAVRAVSVNPVDTKVRMGSVSVPDDVEVLGWDVAAVVEAVGAEVSGFQAGDEVFYSGTITRSGGNAELHTVDERLVGRKPSSLSFAEAAALPLTTLTAWQLLFHRLGVVPGKSPDAGTLLIVGGAGGVGSILIQLASRLTGLTVIATAARKESRNWCLSLGAHHVIDHSQSLIEEVAAIRASPITHIAALTHTAHHFRTLVDVLAPQGRIAIIDDHDSLDAAPLKTKSASLHWEMVFTRPLFATPDMIVQQRILNEVALLLDARVLRTTVTEQLGPLNAANLKRAHALVESGHMLGKVVLARF